MRGVVDVLEAKAIDLPGHLQVRRVLPRTACREVGPFVYLDHLGPTTRGRGGDFETPFHGHCGLSTLTWLYAGAVHHRDSIGEEAVIRPGAVNWMTAGRGIGHIERTDPSIGSDDPMHGLQFWVALPPEAAQMPPAFSSHPTESLPAWQQGAAAVRLVAGELAGRRSPVTTHSPLFLLDIDLPAAGTATIELPEGSDAALYLAEGDADCGGTRIAEGGLARLSGDGRTVDLAARDGVRGVLFGGRPLPGVRRMWETYVAPTLEEAKAAKAAFDAGAFGAIAG